MAADAPKVKPRTVSMEVRQVREMCEQAGPHGYIAMSCASLLRIICDIAPLDDDVLDIVQPSEEAEDPFA